MPTMKEDLGAALRRHPAFTDGIDALVELVEYYDDPDSRAEDVVQELGNRADRLRWLTFYYKQMMSE